MQRVHSAFSKMELLLQAVRITYDNVSTSYCHIWTHSNTLVTQMWSLYIGTNWSQVCKHISICFDFSPLCCVACNMLYKCSWQLYGLTGTRCSEQEQVFTTLRSWWWGFRCCSFNSSLMLWFLFQIFCRFSFGCWYTLISARPKSRQNTCGV